MSFDLIGLKSCVGGIRFGCYVLSNRDIDLIRGQLHWMAQGRIPSINFIGSITDMVELCKLK